MSQAFSLPPKACQPLALGELLPDQHEHLRAVWFSPLAQNEEASLAQLAGAGQVELLARKMDERPDIDPSLAVVWAAENGRLDCLRLCLARFEPSSFHSMATALAARNGRLDCFEALLEGLEPPARADALRWAIHAEDQGCSDLALASLGGMDPDRFAPTDGGGWLDGGEIALDIASRSSSAWPVPWALRNLPAPSEQVAEGALVRRARRGDAGGVRALLPFGPQSIDPPSLLAAVEARSAPCVDMLIPRTDPQALDNAAIVMAVDAGATDCLRLLAPLCNVDARGGAPLRHAILLGDVESVRILAPLADLSLVDGSGRSFMDLAAMAGSRLAEEFDGFDCADEEELEQGALGASNAINIAALLHQAGADFSLVRGDRSPEELARQAARSLQGTLFEAPSLSIAQAIHALAEASGLRRESKNGSFETATKKPSL